MCRPSQFPPGLKGPARRLLKTQPAGTAPWGHGVDPSEASTEPTPPAAASQRRRGPGNTRRAAGWGHGVTPCLRAPDRGSIPLCAFGSDLRKGKGNDASSRVPHRTGRTQSKPTWWPRASDGLPSRGRHPQHRGLTGPREPVAHDGQRPAPALGSSSGCPHVYAPHRRAV